MKFYELPTEERMEITRKIQTVIGTKESWVKADMDRSQRIKARFDYDKMFEKLVKVYMQYGDKALATQFMDYGGAKEGITANGKRWILYMNSFGWTDRCRHCGTLYIDGKCIFTSGTLAKAFEYIFQN